MKKLLALVSVLLVLAMLLCSCTEGSSNTEDETSSTAASSEIVSNDASSETVSNDTSSTTETTSSEVPAPTTVTKTIHNYVITLPADYTVEEAEGIYMIYTSEFPVRTDNININHLAIGDNYALYSAEVLNAALAPVFEEFSGVENFAVLSLDGLPFIVYEYSGTMSGIEMYFTQGILFGSNFTDTITFTQLDTTFDDDFANIFLSLRVAD